MLVYVLIVAIVDCRAWSTADANNLCEGRKLVDC